MMSSELAKRILTGVIMGGLAVGTLLFGSDSLRLGLGSLIFTLVWCEWLQPFVIRAGGLKSRFGLMVIVAYLMMVGVGLLIALAPDGESVARAILVLGVVWWIFAAMSWVILFPRSKPMLGNCWIQLPSAVLVILAAFGVLVIYLQTPEGANLILWLVVVVCLADIGAYFFGRLIGGVKLAPRVSPGKTWAGAIGGVCASSCFCVLFFYWSEQTYLIGWLGLTLILIAVSIFGDLFESALKRTNGLKDSSQLLPGHGGMFDRLDSLLFAMPVFAILQPWMTQGLGI